MTAIALPIYPFFIGHRPSAKWYIIYSSTGTHVAIPFGGPDNTPVQDDYDGDGITDIAFFLRNTQQWYIRESSTGGTRLQQWGVPGSRPVPADYDGDGKTDLAVYWPLLGKWHILESSTGRHRQERFGSSVQRPVPGYFDDDIYADVAIYSPKSGNWHILESTTGQIVTRFWGALNAPAVPADYDGDGITDIAVFHPQGRKWYIRRSTDAALHIENGGGSMARAIAAYAQGAVENLRLHCHGDSITYGTDSALNGPATAYPIRLEEHLEGGFGGDIVALNHGNPGESTGSGRSRLAFELALSRANVLLIMEGVNDHFFNTNFNTIESNLRAMVLEGLV